MVRADSINTKQRRDFLLLTAAACTTVLAARPALASPTDDSALLALEEQIFEQYRAAAAYDDEIIRLSSIWTAETRRLYEASLAGDCVLSAKERWDLVGATPECKEHTRLTKLQDVPYAKMDALIKEMWSNTCAHGRRTAREGSGAACLHPRPRVVRGR